MPTKLTNFGAMWSNYPAPAGSAEEAKALIGGAVNAGWITNTCVLRISRSFNAAGHKIPKDYPGLLTLAGADGLRYAFRVEEFRKYLTSAHGAPDLTVDGAAPGGGAPPSLLGKKGVIGFLVSGWTDATGHFDLWNGEACIHAEYFARASKVFLWLVDDQGEGTPPVPRPPAAPLSGSVGQGGLNRRADVETVQRLLMAHGEDVGTPDGVVGPRTVRAIRSFQIRFVSTPDGRVDVGGRTWQELNKI